MKTRKKILSALQFLLGVGLVVWLASNINNNTTRIDFTTTQCTIEKGAVYECIDNNTTNHCTVLETVKEDTTVATFVSGELKKEFSSNATLTLKEGSGPQTIQWSNQKLTPDYGFRLIGSLFKDALDHWPALVIGMMGFFLCLLTVMTRWWMLLKAQGLTLSFGKVMKLYFVGHFFNSFLPGATSGDLIKAYYATKEAPEKKTEAVATVFLDRIIGLLALVSLAFTVMLIRLPFFLAHKPTRIAIIFNGALLVGAAGGLFMVFRQNLFEKWSFFRKLESKTALGGIISKVYNSFRVCLNHPGLLTKTLLLSLANHVLLITCTFFLGISLEINMSYFDYLSVFPFINAVGCIPLTPGGLGTREAVAVWTLGVLGVPQAKAFFLSLLVYISYLIWSLVGGVVYPFYSVPKKEN